ncbi:unnamed protein product [Rotaria sordida]|uniref:RING-type domain-containing protein n=1 Tax=Rotaria sordida TaxID=392033 RepID=A0A814RC63_9BILA|nr:unnamed protein product [Rotaria sordida]
MEDNTGYEYMNEESINERLKCSICTKPFIDPVSTKCNIRNHIFCHHCIEEWIKHHPSCPMCRQNLRIENLTPIADSVLIDMLDEILVKCLGCKQTGLVRGSFNDHKNKMCSKTNIKCLSSDIKCPWTGSRDELDKHLKTCIFNPLRPLITELINNNQQLKNQVNQQQTQIGGLINDNQQLKGQVNQQQTQIRQLQDENQQLKNQTGQLEKRLQFLEFTCPKPLSCFDHSY